MRRMPKVVGICGLSALLALAMAPAAEAHGDDHGHESTITVLKTGLSSPKGLAVNRDRNLVIGQGAFGPPGPVLEFDIRGRNSGTTTPLTDPANLTDVAVSPRDGTGWGITASDESAGVSAHLVHQLRDGTIKDVLDIAAYQATDPDPVDQDQPPNPTESNAYGLTVDRKGNALIADAAGNDVIRVTPDGVAVTVARFDIQDVSTDQLPADLPIPLPDPLPATIPAEAVPTTVTVGQDGAIYVGELKGFPFHTGSSNIWRIRPDAEGAWCSVEKPTDCSLCSSGYTAIQDIAFGSSGRLFVYELAKDGVLAFEAGMEPGGTFPPAVLLQVDKDHRGDRRTELAAGQLSQPGGVVVVNNDVYVTDGVFSDGRLSKIDD